MMSLYVRIRNAMLQQEEGQGMVEYGLIIGLVAVGVIALLTAMGGQIGMMFDRIATTLSGV